MDAGAQRNQPSVLSLFATAVVCGALIAVAHHDRNKRLAQAESQPTPAADAPHVAAPPLALRHATPVVAPPLALGASPTLAPPAGMPDADPWSAYDPAYVEATPCEPSPWSNLTEAELPAPAEQPSAPTPVAKPAPAAVADKPAAADAVADAATPARVPPTRPVEEPPTAAVAKAPSPAEDITPLQDAPAPETRDQAAQAAAAAGPRELQPYLPATTEVSERVAPQVRAAFSLGRHGALYAAHRKFVEIMRTIAAAKDTECDTRRHTQALDAGLTALDEARDFLPGGLVSKELTVAEAVASHRTPVLHGSDLAPAMLPRQAAARYYRYAEQKLAQAVAGEQAGSMALYGLGKTHAQLARIEENPIDEQKSLAMYRAAVLAHHGNHLASNELGVGLARAGHYAPAAQALTQSVHGGGGSTVYRNLARVQRKLGQPQLAQRTEASAERLAQQERAAGVFSRERGVQWVPPNRMAGGHAPTQPAVATQPQSPPQQPSGPGRLAKRLFGHWSEKPAPTTTTPAPHRQANATAAPVSSQTTIRR